MPQDTYDFNRIDLNEIYSLFHTKDERRLDSVKEFIEAENYMKAIHKLNEISSSNEPAVILKGILFLYLGDMQKAISLWKPYIKKNKAHPLMMRYYAIACHSSEKYKEAVRVFKTVYPTDTRKDEIVLSYAFSLKEVHKYKTARNLILPFYSSTVGDDLIAVIQNMEFTTLLLELDVLLQDEDSYSAHFAPYLSQLSSVMIFEDAKELLACNIVILSGYMSTRRCEWLAPHFYELVRLTDKNNYLKDTPYEIAVKRGYTSWESYFYQQDEQVPKPLKEIGLYPLEELEIDDEVSQSVICWNAAKLYQTQPECFRYMRSTYPHTWNKIEYIVDKFKSKPTDYQKQLEKRIMLYVDYSQQELHEELERRYKKAYKTQHDS